MSIQEGFKPEKHPKAWLTKQMKFKEHAPWTLTGPART